MTSNETIDANAPDHASATDEVRHRPLLAQILVYVGLCLAVGCVAAWVGLSMEDGFEIVPSLVILAIVIAGLALLVIGVRIGNFDTPSLSSKTGRSQLILVVSGLLGAVIASYLVINGTMVRFFEGDFTITRIEAITALIILFVVLIPMAFLRERNADDFEKAAAKDAAYWSFSAYLYGYLAWSIAAAGDLVPALNSAYLFLILVFLFLGIWVYKRSG